jgi:hypothetical protein
LKSIQEETTKFKVWLFSLFFFFDYLQQKKTKLKFSCIFSLKRFKLWLEL